ncbi:MAG: HD family phosphohydrolase [Candidatus Hepatoplasma vulgare]|nr:MAG: HD family phosphohydrolase [Candidatus Hepatoplasma sp.]
MKKKYIVDPVLGEILIEDELIFNLMETKEFRRLHWISHLGFTDFLFPAATFTRYLHSLGVYEIARRMLNVLKAEINENTERAILSAALLHDLGHGIFSHSFENISQIKHEKYSLKIITSDETEINKIFLKYHPDVLKETILILKGKHPLRWINQLISSEIDADRIDYLLRDSYFTGALFGKIDLNYLLKNILIFKNELVFQYKALSLVESIVLARLHMNKSVYKNLKSFSLQEQFIWLFNRLRFLNDNNLLNNKYDELLLPLYKKELSVKEFLKLDDILFLNALRKIQEEENDNIIKQLSTNILEKRLPKVYETEEEINNLKNEIIPEQKNQTWNIITLNKSINFLYTTKKNEAKILIDNSIYSLREVSSIIKNKSNDKNFSKKVGVSI